MSINFSLSSDGLEEVYTPPTLKEMCLYKCWTNKEILTKEVEVEDMERLQWEKFRLKEPIQKDLVEALLDAAKEFMMTPKYEPVLAAIRMSQPEHLVKVHVSNSFTLKDRQLEFLLSGGNVKSLDIHECMFLGRGSLDAINTFGNKLEYLRIGNQTQILPEPVKFTQISAILRTPNLKTFIVSEIDCTSTNVTTYWRFLLQDFIGNLEDLQINDSRKFVTLEFLEPAKNKLTSLTLSNCKVTKNANAWASLFKLDKLRSLNLVGSSIEKALVGENVVHTLLTTLPNLTRLAVNPGLVKDIHLDSSILRQGSGAKRLEFLGIMDNDVTELRKAKLLANDVAHFGTVEGELHMLKYFSNRLSGVSDSTLTRLLQSLSEVAGTLPSYKTVTVIHLFMKTFRNNGVIVAEPESFFQTLEKLLTTDVAAKLGNVLLDQCIATIYAFISRWPFWESLVIIDDREMISDAFDIMMNLDGELCLSHYLTLVPILIRLAERDLHYYDYYDREEFTDLMKKIAQLLEKAVDRFPGETNNEKWGISTVLVAINKFKEWMVSDEENITDPVKTFSIMIALLLKLCLNSGPRRAAFHSAKGVDIVMDLLKEIIDGRLGFADRDSFALLELLKIILQDMELELDLDSEMITSGLERLLLSIHSQWKIELYKNIHYFQMEIIASLLNYLESDPRFDYNISGAMKEIMMKLK